MRVGLVVGSFLQRLNPSTPSLFSSVCHMSGGGPVRHGGRGGEPHGRITAVHSDRLLLHRQRRLRVPGPVALQLSRHFPYRCVVDRIGSGLALALSDVAAGVMVWCGRLRDGAMFAADVLWVRSDVRFCHWPVVW